MPPCASLRTSTWRGSSARASSPPASLRSSIWTRMPSSRIVCSTRARRSTRTSRSTTSSRCAARSGSPRWPVTSIRRCVQSRCARRRRLELPANNRLLLTTEPQSLVTVEDRTGEPDRSAILHLHPERDRDGSGDVSALGPSGPFAGVGHRDVVDRHGSDDDVLPTAGQSRLSSCCTATCSDIEDAAHIAELIRLLHAHVERTDAIIVADGITMMRTCVMARAMGARFGTGPTSELPSHSPLRSIAAREDPIEAHFTRNLPAQGTPFTIAQSTAPGSDDHGRGHARRAAAHRWRSARSPRASRRS